MSMLRGRVLVVAALLVGLAAAGVYATRLSHAPIYLTHDEVNFSLQSIALAQTGRDLNGRLLPVYFSEPEFTAGRDPMMIYVTALGLTILPLSDAAVRLPTALVGVLVVVLLLVLYARRSPRWWSAIVAAAFLALSPGLFIHSRLALSEAAFLALSPGLFIHSRLALSVIYPLPFVLLWLLALHEYDVKPRPWLLFAGAASLGVGIYGYLAGVVMMPLYLAITVWFARAWRSPRLLVSILTGFAIVLLPIALWHLAHPERYAELMHAYRFDDSANVQTAPVFSASGLRARLGAWWQYFNPDFMFLSGDSSLTNSTRAAGFFPAAFALLLPLGMLRLRNGSRFEWIILVGFVTGPLAAVATGTLDLNRYRAMFVLPFGALVAAHGVEWLWASRSAGRRAVAILLIASVPIQFAGFYRDYMGRYRESSAVWFGQNIRGALAVVFERGVAGDPLLISGQVPYADSYARFYSQVIGGRGAPESPLLIDGATLDLDTVGQRSWLIAGASERWLVRLSSREWVRVAEIREPSGDASFVVYRRASAQ